MKNEGNFSITLNYQDHIAMIVFAELKENVEQTTQSQYRNRDGATAPNLFFGK
jgi:deoxycytidine triphosphate deaminase